MFGLLYAIIFLSIEKKLGHYSLAPVIVNKYFSHTKQSKNIILKGYKENSLNVVNKKGFAKNLM